MTDEWILRHAKPVPRYTSYPTANHFSASVGRAEYRSWLAALAEEAPLSLYLHVPFCDTLCWYCGCTTKATRRYEPIADYVEVLRTEIDRLGAVIPGRRVSHVHWGGGSPNILAPSDIEALAERLHAHFRFDQDAEFAVEIDPRRLEAAQVAAFAAAGVNRISVGVQDFDPAVQNAIGREQSYAQTEGAIAQFRSRGVRSVNVDLVYGLPHQTVKSLDATIDRVLELDPDRIAIFGYAHIPSRMKHQRLIDESALPGAVARHAQANWVSTRLASAGYVQRGLDHFAHPRDAMADATLARNFQGYTTDQAEALIGLGASAISQLPQGFAQNAVATCDYARQIERGDFATARGHRFSAEDRVRAAVIERLMCGFDFSAHAVEVAFGPLWAARMAAIAEAVVGNDADGFVRPTADGFAVTARGRPFVRSLCAQFDAYWEEGVPRRHALAI